LGNLAYKLGFKSNKIYRLRLLSPNDKKVREALLYGRKPDFFKYDYDDFKRFVRKIVRMY
ncbi:hypothetical protein V2W45_1234639, partial [Cenococcum geophilum]